MLATCLQHEIDHLNGILFIHHLSRLKRDRITRKFAKTAKHEFARARAGTDENKRPLLARMSFLSYKSAIVTNR